MLGALKAPPPTGPLRVDSGCKPRLSPPDSNRRSQGVPALPPLARQHGAQVGHVEHDLVPPSRPAEQRRGRRRGSRQAAAARARAVRVLTMTMTMNKGQRPTNTPTSDVVTNGGRTER